MLKRKRTVKAMALTTLGTAAVLSTFAFASGTSERGPVVISDVQIKMDERFNTIDEDNSETLTLEEYLAASPEEGQRAGHRMRRMGKHGGHAGRRGDAEKQSFDRDAFEADVFAAMDLDGDGALSSEEASRDNRKQATRIVMRGHRFARLDTNSDGVVDRTEFNAPVIRLSAADTDADGAVTRSEMRSARKAKKDSSS